MTKVINASDQARELPLPDGRVVVVEPGSEVETTKDHAEALCKQEKNWRAARAPKTKGDD